MTLSPDHPAAERPPESVGPRLRPYQRECLARLRDRYREGKRRVLVSLPTGTGKTVIFASLPRFFRMKRRMLVLAHRQELLEQAAEKLRAAAPELALGIEQGARHAPEDARVVLASVPTLGRVLGNRLGRLDPSDFYLVVVDEAHHAVAASYRRVLEHFGLFAPGTPRMLIGFTATPRRGDGQALGEVFEEIAFARGLPEMVRDGFLCPIRGWRITTAVSLAGVHVRHGDFVESELGRAVNVDQRNRLVVDAYRRIAPGRRALVFCVDVAHVQAQARAFAAAGVPAAAIWGAMDPGARRDALGRFRAGKLAVLTNCNVLTEGFDEPRVGCVLMARPTHSALLYAQMVGRGTRLHPGKTDLVVVDIVDNSERHRLAGLERMFDLPAGFDLRGANAFSVAAELERVGRACPWLDLGRLEHAGELELVCERVDLLRFEPPAEIAAFTDLAWCQSPGGGFRLNMLEGEWIAIEEDNLGRWRIDLHLKDAGGGWRLPTTTRDAAQAVAEVDAVVARQRPDALRVLAVDARWRSQAATEKQLGLLRRWRIPHPAGLTRGQASWMIALSGSRARSG